MNENEPVFLVGQIEFGHSKTAKFSKPGGLTMTNQTKPKTFDEAVTMELNKGHAPRAAIDEAARAHPELLASFGCELRTAVTPDADEDLARKAQELAAREGISLHEAQMRVFQENPDLAARWFASL